MKRKSLWISILLTTAAIIAAVFGIMKYREHQQVATAVGVNTQVMDSFISDKEMSVDQRWDLFMSAKRANEGLSNAQRKEVERQSWNMMRAELNRKVDEYFELEDRADRNAFIDRELDRWEDLEDDMKELRKRGKAEREKNGESGDAGSNGERRGGPTWARGGAGGGGGGGGGPGGNMNRMRGMLEKTTPNERAKFTKFFMAVMARRMMR